MSAPKLCKDCRWCVVYSRRHPRTAQCYHPQVVMRSAPSLVDGSTTSYPSLCYVSRSTEGRCGRDGLYYEPSRLRRILAALGLATLPGCAADADAILVAAAVLAPLWVIGVARRLRRRWA